MYRNIYTKLWFFITLIIIWVAYFSTIYYRDDIKWPWVETFIAFTVTLIIIIVFGSFDIETRKIKKLNNTITNLENSLKYPPDMNEMIKKLEEITEERCEIIISLDLMIGAIKRNAPSFEYSFKKDEFDALLKQERMIFMGRHNLRE